MAPKRKAAAAAEKRIRGEQPALRAEASGPPAKKRKITKTPAKPAKKKTTTKKTAAKATKGRAPAKANANAQKNAKYAPSYDMVDDPEVIVRQKRTVWKPARAPPPLNTYDHYMHETRINHFVRRAPSCVFAWRPVVARTRSRYGNAGGVEADYHGAELERAPARVPPKTHCAQRLPPRRRWPHRPRREKTPTQWHGTFDLLTGVGVDLDAITSGKWDEIRQAVGDDVEADMRVSLGWDTDLLHPEEAMEMGFDDVPEVGILTGVPISVGDIAEMLASCGLIAVEDAALPWSHLDVGAPSIPLILTHGRVDSALTFDNFFCELDDGYIAKLRFPDKSDFGLKTAQVVITGEGGIKLRKLWACKDPAPQDTRPRELFLGHFEFTVTVQNVAKPQDFVTKTLRKSFWARPSTQTIAPTHPSYLGLPRDALETLLPMPYCGPEEYFPIPTMLSPTPAEQSHALPPLDFSGTFWFVSPHNPGLRATAQSATSAISAALLPHHAWLEFALGDAAAARRALPPPDNAALQDAYARLHAELGWTLDNSGTGWTDGCAVLAEGARGPVRAPGVGLRGRASVACDGIEPAAPLRMLLHAGVEVVGGHVGPVLFPQRQRACVQTVAGMGSVDDDAPDERWEWGFSARLVLAPDDDDARIAEEGGAARRTGGQGELKMRRVWAYGLPAAEGRDALAGELFEGFWAFTRFDAAGRAYEHAEDTFFALRWPSGEFREGKRQLAEQKTGSRTRVERWRTAVEPLDRPGWQPDEMAQEFHCYRHDQKEQNWARNDPLPDSRNFFTWLGPDGAENPHLDWKHPPKPDGAPELSHKAARKVRLIVNEPPTAPQEGEPAIEVDEPISISS
ncbi:hypothetical protein PsYK624_160890 [Phanerochaete sordida]|uniref:Uncharacterized protein n=1 Tax=Phanerochaete sordida TaxID=48140 RepID=A0A9P3GQU0_9APHY|nr:hypothetical protein PsYK624_160890 [Phanerochaete sordida]